ncbi:hypothetical protein RRG08_001587 [Elysia crispata]|uniref:Uncharacterized protein n=1 Tax=Elysia crispata TaxID=231223 RepID=A0AAE1DZX4_9GAST|nr:hypothetical protein RRG08_001587 [Elysia crispata]
MSSETHNSHDRWLQNWSPKTALREILTRFFSTSTDIEQYIEGRKKQMVELRGRELGVSGYGYGIAGDSSKDNCFL